MPYHDDLLILARELVDQDPNTPRQAVLRRAVSTAYYALFHLLIDEGTARILARTSLRPRIARTFEHKFMNDVCQVYIDRAAQAARDFHGGRAVPAELTRIATAFSGLQKARISADYDLVNPLTYVQADADVKTAEQAFLDWLAIQSDSESDYFLAELWCRGIPKR